MLQSIIDCYTTECYAAIINMFSGIQNCGSVDCSGHESIHYI